MKELTIGDHVRVKSTGEIMVVDAKTEVEGASFLLLSEFGHMAGGLNIYPDRTPVRRDEVTRVVLSGDWVDDD